MLISLTVGKVDAGVAVLLTQDKRLIEFPSILLPPNISSGSIVDITVSRNQKSETKSQDAFLALQESIFSSFGKSSPQPPVLRCRNATQTSVVLEWDPIDLATADIISLSLFRNGQKAGNIPKPTVMQTTKISGLAVDTEYTFHLVLRTSAGTFSSEKVVVRTHKMTDLSGITVTPGILPAQLRESLARAVERIGAKIADTVRIDTTHFVTTEGRGVPWERALEMNIPVVRPEWVEGCERGGRIVGVRGYYLDADPKQRPVSQMTVVTDQQRSPERSEAPVSTTPQSNEPVSRDNVDGGSTSPAIQPSRNEKENVRPDDDDDDVPPPTAQEAAEAAMAAELAKAQHDNAQVPQGQPATEERDMLNPAMRPHTVVEAVKDEDAEGEQETLNSGAASFQDVAL